MELLVENLGRIRQARVELRPLTVFVGPNHTNKTWLAYAALTGIRDLSDDRRWQYDDPRPDELLKDTVTQRILGDMRAVVTGSEDFVRLRLRKLGPAGRWPIRPQDLSQMVGVEVGRPEVAISLGDGDALPAPEEMLIERRGDPDRGRAEIVFTVQHPGGSPHHFATAPFSRSPAVVDGTLRFAILQLVRAYFTVAHSVVPFPVERVSSPIGDSGVLKAYQEYLELLRTMPSPAESAHDRQLAAVLSGDLVAANGGSISFRFRDGPEMPVRASASLVRSLAALGLYVSRRARSGDWLVIDEPEMNAHPEAQLAIAELLALLVSSGVRVLFTTHSPYIVDHLNNLMAAWRVAPDRRAGLEDAFALRDARAFLDPEKVAAYEFVEDGAAVRVEDILRDRSEALIDNSTFGRQTERLGDIFNAILDRS